MKNVFLKSLVVVAFLNASSVVAAEPAAGYQSKAVQVGSVAVGYANTAVNFVTGVAGKVTDFIVGQAKQHPVITDVVVAAVVAAAVVKFYNKATADKEAEESVLL